MNKAPFLLLFAVALAFTACNNDDDNTPPVDTNIVNLTATIDGKQEVPTTPSTATGTFTGTLNKTTRVLTYVVTYVGLTVTAGHLHRGAPGVAGPVVIPFSSLTSPINGTATLRQTLADSLVNGLVYVNLHTAAYPATGEIRGNITVKP
ncbi:MAG: CHRD domain-containing protein [Cytophagaceae bacterium]|nr:CHRD domain-containing protein [Cytophagaceae bacterium]